MGHINTLQDLFRTLDQESLSHNQTNEIISSISKIHHHRSVMLNELYLLTLPHIIHKWHQKMITGTNSSANRDYKIQQIKQIFDLVPIGSPPLHQSPEVNVFIGASREIAIHLMLGTATDTDDLRIQFLKFVYQHWWQQMLPPFETIVHWNDNYDDDSVSWIEEGGLDGLIVLHPKYIETNWSNHDIASWVQLYDSETLTWEQYRLQLSGDLCVAFNANFVIKILQSTDRLALRRFINCGTFPSTIFGALLYHTMRGLFYFYMDDPLDNDILQSLLLELNRHDALDVLEQKYAFFLNLDADDRVQYPRRYLEFISIICTVIIGETDDDYITHQRNQIIAKSTLLWIENNRTEAIDIMAGLATPHLFDPFMLHHLVTIYGKCTLVNDKQCFLANVVTTLCHLRSDWNATDLFKLKWKIRKECHTQFQARNIIREKST